MTIVYYTNVNIPLTGGDTITGSFTVQYNDSANPTLTAVNLTAGGTTFTNTSGVAINNISSALGLPNTYQFQVYIITPSVMEATTIAYTINPLDLTQIVFVSDFGPATGLTFYTFDDFFTLNSFTHVYNSNSATVDGSFDPVCFLWGTKLLGPHGCVPIQDLRIGDSVLNNHGEEVVVKWIGKQRIHASFAKIAGALPICIKSGAVGNGLPHRDLYVSPDHAMFIDNCVLVHAKALVNGTSIYQVTEWNGDVEYFHIETENHEIILAEGAPAETFVDNVSRKAFYNYAEYEALYPDAKPMVELDIPRVKFARQLPMAIKRRLEFNQHGRLVSTA